MRVRFHSRNPEYRSPFGAVPHGERVCFTFPVSRDVRAYGVVFCIRRYEIEGEIRIDMPFWRATSEDNIFRLEYVAGDPGVYFYRFEIHTDSGVLYVGNNGDGGAIIGEWLPEWQLTVYNKKYVAPQGWTGGILYHAFVDRFCRVGEVSDAPYGVMKGWDEDVTIVDPDGVYRANDFYGGNFNGIRSKIPYLKRMGVTALYLSPVFKSSSNHRYDTGDYMTLDPMLGTEEDFKNLTDALHAAGIKLILDGVFNHTGADSLYFNKFGHYPTTGAYQSKDSPYHSWYTFDRFPDDYLCWWGVTVVPTVRRDAQGFQTLIAGEGGVIEKWTKLGVDGWRLDVADELSTPFLERIFATCRRLGAAVIGEVWEDASTKISYGEKRGYLFGGQLDGVMNYPFREAILDYVRGGDAAACVKKIMTIAENYPAWALEHSMTLVGTHDTVRVLNALADVNCPETKEERKRARITGEDYQKALHRVKLAAALQYLLPGMPTVYYGDEAGMQGYEDPINRRPYTMTNASHYDYYCRLGEMRTALKAGKADGFSADGDGSVLRLKLGDMTAVFNMGDAPVAYVEKRRFYGISPDAPEGVIPPKDYAILINKK